MGSLQEVLNRLNNNKLKVEEKNKDVESLSVEVEKLIREYDEIEKIINESKELEQLKKDIKQLDKNTEEYRKLKLRVESLENSLLIIKDEAKEFIEELENIKNVDKKYQEHKETQKAVAVEQDEVNKYNEFKANSEKMKDDLTIENYIQVKKNIISNKLVTINLDRLKFNDELKELKERSESDIEEILKSDITLKQEYELKVSLYLKKQKEKIDEELDKNYTILENIQGVSEKNITLESFENLGKELFGEEKEFKKLKEIIKEKEELIKIEEKTQEQETRIEELDILIPNYTKKFKSKFTYEIRELINEELTKFKVYEEELKHLRENYDLNIEDIFTEKEKEKLKEEINIDDFIERNYTLDSIKYKSERRNLEEQENVEDELNFDKLEELEEIEENSNLEEPENSEVPEYEFELTEEELGPEQEENLIPNEVEERIEENSNPEEPERKAVSEEIKKEDTENPEVSKYEIEENLNPEQPKTESASEEIEKEEIKIPSIVVNYYKAIGLEEDLELDFKDKDYLDGFAKDLEEEYEKYDLTDEQVKEFVNNGNKIDPSIKILEGNVPVIKKAIDKLNKEQAIKANSNPEEPKKETEKIQVLANPNKGFKFKAQKLLSGLAEFINKAQIKTLDWDIKKIDKELAKKSRSVEEIIELREKRETLKEEKNKIIDLRVTEAKQFEKKELLEKLIKEQDEYKDEFAEDLTITRDMKVGVLSQDTKIIEEKIKAEHEKIMEDSEKFGVKEDITSNRLCKLFEQRLLVRNLISDPESDEFKEFKETENAQAKLEDYEKNPILEEDLECVTKYVNMFSELEKKEANIEKLKNLNFYDEARKEKVAILGEEMVAKLEEQKRQQKNSTEKEEDLGGKLTQGQRNEMKKGYKIAFKENGVPERKANEEIEGQEL